MSEPLTLKVKLIHPDAFLPVKAHPSDAAFDLTSPESVTVWPRTVVKVPLGIAVELPAGHFGLILGRSSLGAKGIDVLAGCVDPGYRGEVAAVFANNGRDEWEVRPGERIAQLVLLPVPAVSVVEVSDLGETERGGNGFGSSDRKNVYRCPACLLEFPAAASGPVACPACGRLLAAPEPRLDVPGGAGG